MMFYEKMYVSVQCGGDNDNDYFEQLGDTQMLKLQGRSASNNVMTEFQTVESLLCSINKMRNYIEYLKDYLEECNVLICPECGEVFDEGDAHPYSDMCPVCYHETYEV